jgi:hypothetical protein
MPESGSRPPLGLGLLTITESMGYTSQRIVAHGQHTTFRSATSFKSADKIKLTDGPRLLYRCDSSRSQFSHLSYFKKALSASVILLFGTNGVDEEALSGPFRRVAYLLDHG